MSAQVCVLEYHALNLNPEAADKIHVGMVLDGKVLQPRFAKDVEAARRFQREARIISALRHTNILSIDAFGAEV